MSQPAKNGVHLDRETCSRKPLIPYRFLILFMVFASTMIFSAIRSVINVAIIAMVNTKDSNSTINGTNQLWTEQQFDWDQHDQGIILGSYWYTYTAIQIFAGNLSDKYNVIHIMLVTQIVVAICSFATPVAVSFSFYYLIAIRMIMGLFQGVTFPCLYNMIENWFSPTELGFAQGLISAGCDIGSGLSAIYTAWVCANGIEGGWPFAFYSMGVINFVFGILWISVVTRDPFSNRMVSDYEKRSLHRIVSNKKSEKPKMKSTPWIKLFTSLPLWTVIITKGIIGLANAVVNSKIPVYLDSVLGYKLENNGLINGLLYVGSGSTQITCGPLSKFIIAKGWISRTATRKIFQTIALAGIAIALLTICELGDNAHLIVACLVMSMFFYGTNLGGDVPIVAEMAPDLIGTTYGFANTVASATGFVAPAGIAFILGDDAGSSSRWILAFEIVAGLQLSALVLFLIFATAEPQPWGIIENPEQMTEQPSPQTTIIENFIN